MGTVGSELALACDGWISRCLNGRPPLLHSGCYGTWLLAFVSAAANWHPHFRRTLLPACLHSSAVPTYSLVYSRICVRSQSCLMSESSAPAAPRSTLQYSHWFFFLAKCFSEFYFRKKTWKFCDFPGFFVMKLIKLATSRSRHFLARHL